MSKISFNTLGCSVNLIEKFTTHQNSHTNIKSNSAEILLQKFFLRSLSKLSATFYIHKKNLLLKKKLQTIREVHNEFQWILFILRVKKTGKEIIYSGSRASFTNWNIKGKNCSIYGFFIIFGIFTSFLFTLGYAFVLFTFVPCLFCWDFMDLVFFPLFIPLSCLLFFF